MGFSIRLFYLIPIFTIFILFAQLRNSSL